ncbi:hypothetical protein XHV734_3419 [Xanthomonas hortorum pv. vitians]|nr:hypothetical protein XHV734_3419 [Xanthomonas hortorum pv. vitians]
MLRKRVSRIDIKPTRLFQMSTEALSTVESGPLLSKKAAVVPITHPCRRSMRVFLYPSRRASPADGSRRRHAVAGFGSTGRFTSIVH